MNTIILTVAASVLTIGAGSAVPSPNQSPAPAAHWLLAGDGSPAAGDLSLTVDGDATWTSDGLVLDGETGYASTAEPGPIDTTGSFTVMAWVKPDGILPYATAVSQLGDAAAAFFLGYGANTWQFGIKAADGPGTQRIATGIVVPVPSTWVQLTGVYDSARQWAQLYVNGHAATPEGVSVDAPFDAHGALHVGDAQREGKPANFWHGVIADVSVYDSALEADQVADVVATSAPDGADLAAPPPPVENHCPFADGGTCLGPLDAGTYTTTTFQPSITYTVPAGWVDGEDLPGNFLLQLENDPRYIGIYRDGTAPLGCEDTGVPGVGHSIDAWADWLTSHPGLVTSEPQPVSVGGLDGVYLDIGLDPGWTTACPFSGGNPVLPFIVGDGISSLQHVLFRGLEERLYLLDYHGGNVAIEIGPEGAGSLDDWLKVVDPVIDSIQFGA